MSGDDLDILTDEYVLGLLDEAEAWEVERQLAVEPLLRAALERSRRRYLDLDLGARPLPTPEGLWSRIADRLGEAGVDAPPPRPSPAIRSDAIRPDPANLPHPPRSWLRRHLATGIAAGVGLVLGAALGREALQPDPVVLTVLVNEAGAPLAVVEDFGDAQARVRFVAEVLVPEGRQMQVWTLPSAEMGPVSLGLLEGPAGQLLRGPDLPLPAQGQLYEITLEQIGGSPTGRPTGPVVAKGLAAAQDV